MSLEAIRERSAAGLTEAGDVAELLALVDSLLVADTVLALHSAQLAVKEFAAENEQYRRALDEVSSVASQACAMLERIEPVVEAARQVGSHPPPHVLKALQEAIEKMEAGDQPAQETS